MSNETNTPRTADLALHSSLVTAIGQITALKATGKNKHLGNEYLTLGDILSGVRPILSKHGLAISQRPLVTTAGAGAITSILHKDGGCYETSLLLPVAQQTAQAIGSAITYARRYTLTGLLGIAADPDDDAESAMPPRKSVQITRPEFRKQEVTK
jgi:ERF superfamily